MRLNLPKLLVTTFWVLCGGALGIEMGRSWGWGVPGYIVGSVTGFAGALALTCAVVVGRIRVLFPFPVCRQGKCRDFRQFSWRRGTIHGWEEWGVYLYKCECGDLYIRRGQRFLHLVRKGEERPYKKLVSFQRWVDDVVE